MLIKTDIYILLRDIIDEGDASVLVNGNVCMKSKKAKTSANFRLVLASLACKKVNSKMTCMSISLQK